MSAAFGDQRNELAVRIVGPDGRPRENGAKCSRRIEDAPFPPCLVDELVCAGFTEASPIQQHAWPLVLQGLDIIGLAQTGSGKTLAFLLPLFSKVISGDVLCLGVISILIVAPTRELALQIEEAAQRFGGAAGIRTVSVYGGVPRRTQIQAIQTRRPQCVVACPGRINDLAGWGQVNLAHVRALVIDEADQLLDMGFEPQVRGIVQRIPTERQNLLFSATWPQSVHKFAAGIMRPDHVEVHIVRPNELRANNDVRQQVMILPNMEAKMRALLDIVRNIPGDFFLPAAGSEEVQSRTALTFTGKVLVFGTSRESCNSVYKRLVHERVRCAITHADHDQLDREQALLSFRTGVVPVLVATDLAARGLDIEGVSAVVSFEPPHSYHLEDYVHRIGRTGRAGKRGLAVTFLGPRDANHARSILQVMRLAGQDTPKELEALAAQARGSAQERRAAKHREFLEKKRCQGPLQAKVTATARTLRCCTSKLRAAMSCCRRSCAHDD